MKNKIFINSLFILFFLITILLSSSYSEEIEFVGEEINILDDGKKITGRNGIEIFLNNRNQIITADKFEYDKTIELLVVSGKVFFDDKASEIEILSDKAIYKTKDKIYEFDGNVNAKFLNKYLLETNQIQYNKTQNLIISSTPTKIEDNLNNNFLVSSFRYHRTLNQINADQVIFSDNQKNKYELDKAVLDLNSNQILGKDIIINFNNNFFGNKKNEPRIKGASIFSDNDISTVSKGVFTTCKKTEKCPPWVMSAKQVKHDKKKQQLQYTNAWLKIYDKPVLFFPKFYHPDPSVKRQSGFLIPQFSNSNTLGTSIYLPYYKVLSNSKDLTFKPKIYSNEEMLLQSEYRHYTEKSKNIVDASFLKKQNFNFSDDTANHFFSNSVIELDSKNFDETNLEINLQNTSNDTYLKTYKVQSPLLENSSSLHSFFNLYGSNQKTTFDISTGVYEDLTKKNDSDKFTFIYPSYDIENELENNFGLAGNLTFGSEGYQKKYNTNAYDAVMINDLLYRNSSFNKRGIKSDLNFLVKNVNSNGEKSANFKNEAHYQILPISSYKLSYPLSKKFMTYENQFTPITSISYSPTKNESLNKNDERIDINNVFSFNRIGVNDAVESGLALTIGAKYKKKYFESSKYYAFDIAQNFRNKKNDDIPTNGSLGKKTSDIFTNLEFNFNDYLNFNYDFNLKSNLEKTNYDLISTRFTLNNFISSFEYLDDKKGIEETSFISNKTSLDIDESNSFSFATRRNRKIDLTEYYDLMYKYKNDCLEAGFGYKKEFYEDNDLRPEQQIYFTITVMPFGEVKAPSIK